jgi:hypothetical protein
MSIENDNNLYVSTINPDKKQIVKELIFSGNVAVSKNLGSIVVEIPFGAAPTIGVPTGGQFGTTNVAQLLSTDLIADGFSKISLYLEKLTPASPPDLGTFTLAIDDAMYTAIAAVAPYNVYGTVVNSATMRPSATVGPFGNADDGLLVAYVKNSPAAASNQGSVTLTPSDDTGIFGDFLQIVSDVPFNNFCCEMVARIGGNSVFGICPPSNTVEYSYQLAHSLSGNTNVVYFYADDAYDSSPSAIFPDITNVTGTIIPVSGVQVYSAGTVTAEVTAVNCIKKFYNSSWVARISGPAIASATGTVAGLDRNEGSTPNIVMTTTINSGVFTNNLSLLFTVQNSAGVTDTVSGTSTIAPVYIDSISTGPNTLTFSNETQRNKSQFGMYPPVSLDPYDPNESLAVNFEMQLIGGLYQYPPAVNYTSYNPPSADYSTLTNDGGFRHYTQVFTPIVDGSFVQITINTPSGFANTIIDPAIRFTVAIPGTTDWLDANAYYPGVGIPVNNGDPALDFALSTNHIKRVTFGGAVYSGYVLARISVPVSSPIRFSGFSLTYA